ncbi:MULTISPECIES: hypothetical protein [unclassified Spiroplasma]|uniref:hypothetical protein n=1 Tax=unclassified Spiroplasma TaxID=2637901 RepID=UPI00313BB4FE
MKKILIILGETILTVAGTVNLISCENKKNNSFTINKPNLQPNKNNNDAQIIKENEILRYFKNKDVRYITSITITEIKATNPQQVKEYELNLAIKPEILKILKERESSVTENNFVIGFDEYFSWGKPRYIDLSTTNKIVKITILGYQPLKGKTTILLNLPIATTS